MIRYSNPNDPHANWKNSVKQEVEKNQISSNSGFTITSTGKSTTLDLRDEVRYNTSWMNYCGEYDITRGYNVNDVVRVLPGKTYEYPMSNIDYQIKKIYGEDVHLAVGNILRKGRAFRQAFFDCIPTPGVWMCVCGVPDMYFVMDAIIAGQVPEFANGLTISPDAKEGNLGSYVPDDFYFPLIRFVNVNYIPIWPELDNVAYYDTENKGKVIGRYWELISLLPMEQKACVNGKTTTYYIDSASSDASHHDET